MNKYITILGILFIILLYACASTNTGNVSGFSLQGTIAQSVQKTADNMPPKSRVLVAAFESESENLSDYVMEELSGELFDLGFEIADRKNLKYVVRELMFQQTYFVDEKTAHYAGKFMAADITIIGGMEDLSAVYRYRTNAADVKTKSNLGDTNYNIQADKATRRAITDLSNSKVVTKEYLYGEAAAQQTVGTFIDRGLTFTVEMEFGQAITNFNEAIKLKPDMAAAYALRGHAYFWLKEYDRALADMDKAIMLEPDFVFAYIVRGNWYFTTSNFDRCISDIETALRIDPDIPGSSFYKRVLDFARKQRGY